MKLSTKVLSIALVVTLSFMILLLAVLFQYSQSVELASDYVEETQPARAAIEHLLTTIYQDFLLVEEYLLVQEYTELSAFDELLAHSEEECEIITDQVDDLITLNKIINAEAIEHYDAALLVYSSWQRSRNRLLQMHKEALATQTFDSEATQFEKVRFIALMQNSTASFRESLEALNEENVVMQQELSDRTQTVQILLFILVITVLLVSFLGSYLLIQRVARPLDAMSKASAEFTKGNYSKRVEESSGISELYSLQQQLNRVYSLIEKTFTTSDQKEKAAAHLLPSQYKEVLDYIQDSATKGMAPTMKDVKKHFNLTHPTVVSRLKYLEENGYIEIRKQGRNKCIFEV